MRDERWLILVLGLWIVVAAFLQMSPQAVLWNRVIVGVILGITGAALAGVALARATPWRAWGPEILGLLLIIVALLFPGLRTGPGHLWTNLILGLALGVTALTAGGQSARRKRQRPAGA